MNNDKSKISNWLEELQQESWQLELIISGFTIFLLLQASTLITPIFSDLNLHTNFPNNVRAIVFSFVFIVLLAVYALIVNLILHIFLRGFWVAAIGLRSVQKETDFKKLNYSNFFTEKLKNHVISLDKLIEKLDTISSVVFAFAFMVVFMFISFALWAFFLNFVAIFFEVILYQLEEGILTTIITIIGKIIIIIILITSIIYLLDTLTLGFFKRYKWISKAYYPIYKFLGWITLSGIYRSIYYNLISRFPKNNIRLFLGAFIFIGIMVPFNRISFYKYFPDDTSDAKTLASNCYDDTRKKGAKIWSLSLPSEVVDKSFMPLFIRYNIHHNEVLDSLCTDYTPTKTSIWVSGFSRNGFRDPYLAEEDPDKLLDCLSQLYNVYINDSLYTELDYYFYTHPNSSEKGLRTIIDTRDLPKGKNTIFVKRKSFDDDMKITEKGINKIRFWLE